MDSGQVDESDFGAEGALAPAPGKRDRNSGVVSGAEAAPSQSVLTKYCRMGIPTGDGWGRPG